MTHAHHMIASLLLLSAWGCVPTADEPTTGAEPDDTATLEASLSGTAVATITFTNNTAVTATSGTPNFAGTLNHPPAASVAAGQSDQYIETGVGNVSSFHIDYTAGSKKCHFDAASFPSGGTILTPPSCTFTKNAVSQGSASATCTATLIGFDLVTCSQTMTFSMR